MKYRVGISGSYGGMNLGDEAIVEVMIRELRASSLADVVVFSRNPKDTARRHKVRSVSLREMHKEEAIEELKQLDLFVLGGGGILFDGMAECFLRDVNWAREVGVPVMVYAISVGPLRAPESKQLVVETLNRVEKITVREGEAKRILNDLGVTTEIEVTSDPALLLTATEFTEEMLRKDGIDPERPLVGFSVREPGPTAPDLNVDHYHGVLANAADFMLERFDAQALFVPMEQGENRDRQHSHAVIAKMAHAQRANVLKGDYSSSQVLGLVRHMSFAVGMRLHFLIFSCIQRVPFVPLPYASKVTGLLADLEMPMTKIGGLNVGKLCAYLDRSWDTRKNIEKKLETKVPALQDKARRTNQILTGFLSALKPKHPQS
jgi:polysaccharide pyruvyl transferase CsaB